MDDDAVEAALRGRGGRLQAADAALEMDGGDSSDGMSVGSGTTERCAFVEALLFLYAWGLLSLPNC